MASMNCQQPYSPQLRERSHAHATDQFGVQLVVLYVALNHQWQVAGAKQFCPIASSMAWTGERCLGAQ